MGSFGGLTNTEVEDEDMKRGLYFSMVAAAATTTAPRFNLWTEGKEKKKGMWIWK